MYAVIEQHGSTNITKSTLQVIQGANECNDDDDDDDDDDDNEA